MGKKNASATEVWEAWETFWRRLLFRHADLLADLQAGRIQAGVFRLDGVNLHGKLARNLRERVARGDGIGAIGIQHARRSGSRATLARRGHGAGFLGFFDLGDLATEGANLVAELVERILHSLAQRTIVVLVLGGSRADVALQGGDLRQFG